ncbi:integrase [Saccharolobus solfataricus]|nr:integrase [Saccharolobus solfataricus]
MTLVAILRQYSADYAQEFYDYLLNERKIGNKTAKEYVSAVNRPYKETDKSQKAYRIFAKFLESRGVISSEEMEKILRVIKVKRSNADLYIPTEEGIRKTLKLAKEYSENVYFVYRIALESGARLNEILKVLKKPEKDVCDSADDSNGRIRSNGSADGGISLCYYPLSWIRGSKGSFYVFHFSPLRKVTIGEGAIAGFERRRDGAVAIKYVRKFVASKMAELGIPLDVIDFIQGRKPTRVLTQHYISLFGIAKEHYRKYAEWLSKSGVLSDD